MQEGILLSKDMINKDEHIFIKLDNKNTELVVGLHKTHKWDRLRALEQHGLIELKTKKGAAPEAKIIAPRLH